MRGRLQRAGYSCAFERRNNTAAHPLCNVENQDFLWCSTWRESWLTQPFLTLDFSLKTRFLFFSPLVFFPQYRGWKPGPTEQHLQTPQVFITFLSDSHIPTLTPNADMAFELMFPVTHRATFLLFKCPLVSQNMATLWTHVSDVFVQGTYDAFGTSSKSPVWGYQYPKCRHRRTKRLDKGRTWQHFIAGKPRPTPPFAGELYF